MSPRRPAPPARRPSARALLSALLVALGLVAAWAAPATAAGTSLPPHAGAVVVPGAAAAHDAAADVDAVAGAAAPRPLGVVAARPFGAPAVLSRGGDRHDGGVRPPDLAVLALTALVAALLQGAVRERARRRPGTLGAPAGPARAPPATAR